MRLELLRSPRELPGKKKTAGTSGKTNKLVFRKSPLFSPVRLRTGRPAKPACPGAECLHSLCRCGTQLEKSVLYHPRAAGPGEEPPPRRGLGQRPGVPLTAVPGSRKGAASAAAQTDLNPDKRKSPAAAPGPPDTASADAAPGRTPSAGPRRNGTQTAWP